LWNIVAALQCIYIILDALDKCPEQDGLLQFPKEATDWKLENFQLFVTSRSLKDIEEALDTTSARRTCLQNQLVDSDIEAYVRSRLRDD
jgi:hypothetical protein